MVAIVLGVAAILVVLPGGYLFKLSTAEKFSDNLREVRIRLTGQYIQSFSDLYKSIALEEQSSGLSVVEILSGGSHISAIRELGELLSARDLSFHLFRRLQKASLYCRYFVLVLI